MLLRGSHEQATYDLLAGLSSGCFRDAGLNIGGIDRKLTIHKLGDYEGKRSYGMFGLCGFLAGLMIIPMIPAISVLNNVQHMFWLGTFKILLMLFFVGLRLYLSDKETIFSSAALVSVLTGAALIPFTFVNLSVLYGIGRAAQEAFEHVHHHLHGVAHIEHTQNTVLAAYLFQVSDFLVGLSFVLLAVSLTKSKAHIGLPIWLGITGGALLMGIESLLPLSHTLHEIRYNILMPSLGGFLVYVGWWLLRSPVLRLEQRKR